MPGNGAQLDDIWRHYDRLEMSYSSQTKIARCRLCYPEPMTDSQMSQIKLAETSEERRSVAVGFGCVAGHVSRMKKHHREVHGALDYEVGVKREREDVEDVEDVGDVGDVGDAGDVGEEKGVVVDWEAVGMGGKRRKVGGEGDGGRFERKEHDRLIARAIQGGISVEFFTSEVFRSLQEFYCGGKDVCGMNGLYVTKEQTRLLTALNEEEGNKVGKGRVGEVRKTDFEKIEGRMEKLEKKLKALKDVTVSEWKREHKDQSVLEARLENDRARRFNCQVYAGVGEILGMEASFRALVKEREGTGPVLPGGHARAKSVPAIQIGQKADRFFPKTEKELNRLSYAQIEYLSRAYNDNFGINSRDALDKRREKFTRFILLGT